MKFSVVIATCRSLEFFETALNSAIAQTHQPHEILVVDDDSGFGDAKRELLESCSNSHYIHINSARIGATRSRNLAIEQATGEWVAVLDDDDTWQPNYLKAAASCLSDFSWSFCVPRSREIIVDSFYAKKIESPQLIHFLLYRGLGRGSGLIFPLDGIKKVGGFDSRYQICSDRALMLKLLLNDCTPIEIVGNLIKFNEAGGLTRNRELWREEAIHLVEDFFTLPGSELFIEEKEKAIDLWRRKLSPLSPP